MKDFDWIMLLWACWIFFLACVVLVQKTLLVKSLVMICLGLSLHDAYGYYKKKQESEEDGE
tara:strand:- start:1 stop:183 length:183 start_codon:yes stop_codon:yes gene_type:complete